eukprot:gene22801-29521_t
MYANDISINAFIDDAIAYSLALDTFLADPLEFRRKIGKIEKVISVNTEKANEDSDATCKSSKAVVLTPRRSSRLSTNSKKSITKSTIKKSASKLTNILDNKIDIQRDMSLDIIDNCANIDIKSKKRQRLSIDASRPMKRVRRSSTNYDTFEIPNVNENSFDESVVDIIVDDEVLTSESIDDNDNIIAEESINMTVETDESLVVDTTSTPKELIRKTIQTPSTITIQSMEKLLTKSKSKKSISLTDNIELSTGNIDSVIVNYDIDSINAVNISDQEIKIEVQVDKPLANSDVELSKVITNLIYDAAEVTQADEISNNEAVNTNIDAPVAEPTVNICEMDLHSQVADIITSNDNIERSINSTSEIFTESSVNEEIITSNEQITKEDIELVSTLTTTPSTKPRRSTRSKHQETIEANDNAESVSNEQNVTANDIIVNDNDVKTTDTPNSKTISIASSEVKMAQIDMKDNQTPSRSTRSTRNKNLTTPRTVESKRSAKKELIEETIKSVISKPDKSSKSIARKRKQVEIIEEALAILCDSCDEEFIMEDIGLTTVPE